MWICGALQNCWLDPVETLVLLGTFVTTRVRVSVPVSDLTRNKIIESPLQQKQIAFTAEAQRTQRFAEIFSCLVLLCALCASAVNDLRLWCLCMTT